MSTPTFSVLTAVHDPEATHLASCLAAVDDQTEPSWEHVVVDDGSRRREVLSVLAADSEPRRRIMLRSENAGIVAASQHGLTRCVGEFVVLVDHDDVLTPDALATLASAIESAADPQAVDLVYSDHDLLRPDGRTVTPIYKPDFSPVRLCNHNYVTHLVAIRRTLMDEIGGFRHGFDGAQDHDLLLRAAERARTVLHVPEILLHWRQSPRSVSTDPDMKPYAYDAGRRAVADHLDRLGIAATVELGAYPGLYRVRRVVQGRPAVSVVIPTAGRRARIWGRTRVLVHDAVASLLSDAGDRFDIEVVVVVDDLVPHAVLRGLRTIAGDRLVLVESDEPFNFAARVNLGASRARGEYLLVLNDDVELAAPGSLDEMVALAQLADVGAVGAKMLYEDGTLQHGGHVYNGTISHACLGWPGDHPGPQRLLAVERECSGVTAAAMLMRADLYDELGGMSSAFGANYNDVDLCLRVRASGRRIIWTPHAVWWHFESLTFDHPITQREVELLREAWGAALDEDPYYSTNLAPGRTDWLERPGRSGAPPYVVLADGQVSWG